MAVSVRSLRKEKEVQGFVRLAEPMVIRRYVSRAIEIAAAVEVRLPASGFKFSSNVIARPMEGEGLAIAPPAEIPDEVLQADPSGCMVIAFLKGQVLLCIQSQKAEWVEGELRIAPPWTIFKLQRRKEARFEIPAAYELIVSMDTPESGRKRVQRPVIDISPSGMAFLLPPQKEETPLKKGLFLRRMEVFIEGRQIFFDAQVTGVNPSRDPRKLGMKIGLKFVRLGPLDARFIAAYVARNLAQLYG